MNLFNIEAETINNPFYLRVLDTQVYSQLTVMKLQPGQEIGEESHDNDQFFRVESGKGLVIVNGNIYPLFDGAAGIIPAMARHNIINTSEDQNLAIYVVYSPPKHPVGEIEVVKENHD